MADLALGIINLISIGVTDFGKNFFPKLRKRDQGKLRFLIYLLLLLLLFICILMAFFIYERVTSHVLLSSIERKVAILNQLSESGVLTESELKPLYKNTANDLSKSEVVMINTETLFYIYSFVVNLFWAASWKFLSGAGLGIMFLMIALLSSRQGKKEVVKGALKLLMIFGIAGLFLSSMLSNQFKLSSIESNLLAFGTLTIIQLLFLIRYGRKSQMQDTHNDPARTSP